MEPLCCGWALMKAPQALTVFFNRLERISLPFRTVAGRDHVSVSRETQHRPLSTVSCPEIVDLAKGHLLNCETQHLQFKGEQFLAATVIRADGWACKQRLAQVKSGGHGVNCFRAIRR